MEETAIFMADKPKNYLIFMPQEGKYDDMAEVLVAELEVVKSRPSWQSNVDPFCC